MEKNNDFAPFHLAFPVKDLTETHQFYTQILGCSTGRSSDHWIDFNMWGHQVVAHLSPDEAKESSKNAVDGHGVPVRHFGVILSMEDWEVLAERVRDAGVSFIIEPYIRFKGEAGEQATMFFMDPFGNAIEFKAMANPDYLFAK